MFLELKKFLRPAQAFVAVDTVDELDKAFPVSLPRSFLCCLQFWEGDDNNPPPKYQSFKLFEQHFFHLIITLNPNIHP